MVTVETTGDIDRASPLWEIAGAGVFVREVQAAVLDGRADLAVHSAKDLPASVTVPGLVIAAVPERGDPRDALVGRALADLPPGAVIATGSIRRRAQLAHIRPDLTFTGVRGNVGTRVAAAASVGAVPVAAVALDRLGLGHHAADILDPATMCPQVGQGALAVECRVGDEATLAVLATADHAASRTALETERAFLAAFGFGCDAPLGALATVGDDGTVLLDGVVCTHDGRVLLRRSRGGEGSEVGGELAAELIELGGHLIDGLVAS